MPFKFKAVAQKEVYLTKERLDQLLKELEELRTVRRHEVADRIRRAIEVGGTVNNAEYDDAKNEQAFVEGRIATLENMVNNAVIISEQQPHTIVEPGSRVLVKDESGETTQYYIVGSAEADPSSGKISNESPVGRALMGKKPGDTVEVKIPAGTMQLTILEVA